MKFLNLDSIAILNTLQELQNTNNLVIGELAQQLRKIIFEIESETL